MGDGAVKRLYAECARSDGRRVDTRRLTTLALLTAAALVLSLVESMLPPLLPIAPGAKLGLSNIAPLVALILLGVPDAFIVMTVKSLLGAALSGGLSGLMYSLPSGTASLAVEALMFYLLFGKTSLSMISLVGAVVFNAVQLCVACAVTGVDLLPLLPPLIAAGILAGAFTGLAAYYIIKKLPYTVYGVRRRK